MLRLTEQNKLEFASPAVKKSLGSAPQLYQEIIEERYALLLEAAHHALAGRHRNAAPITIYDELSYNYRDLLNYENRRLHNAKKRASALYKDHQHTQEADREHDQYFGIDDTTNSLFKEDEN